MDKVFMTKSHFYDGDTEAVRLAFASGFDPRTPDRDGRTIQIASMRLPCDGGVFWPRELCGTHSETGGQR